MEHLLGATIIPILLSNNKTIMSFSHGNQILWPVYITIRYLDAKTQSSLTKPDTLLLGFIFIVYGWLENRKNKDKNFKAKIYNLVLKIIL